MDLSWIEDIASRAEQKFSNWQPQTWQKVVEGPAAKLIASLEQTGRPAEQTRPVLKTYLKLAAEAVGLGYIYPADQTGRANFFTRVWFELLPRELASLEPARQTEVLSACWNVGENLETRAPWLRAIFMDLVSSDGLSLASFERDVRRVNELILERPEVELGADNHRLAWVHLGKDDPRFMPGQVEFLAPQVVVVYHRHTGLDDQPKAAKVVWLGGSPAVLGAAGEALRNRQKPGEAKPSETSPGDTWRWKALSQEEPRLTSIHASARNRWRAVCTLETSQFLAVASPDTKDGRGA
jgi:hypothetical protein